MTDREITPYPHDLRLPLLGRAIAITRNPRQLERALGVVLWIAFFAVLLAIGN